MSSDDKDAQQQLDHAKDQDRKDVNASGSEKPADPSAAVADRSSQSKEETDAEAVGTLGENTENDGEQDTAASSSSAADTAASNVWTAAWDEGSQAYYWWNMLTYETTWDNPYEKNALDKVLDEVDAKVQAQEGADEQSDTRSGADASQYPGAPAASFGNQSYTYQAYFNARTGRFQTSSEVDRLNPERLSIENRAKRQMQYYFDVDAYTEERNRERAAGAAGQKRQLSKKEVERFKRAKHEKKLKRARDWLCD